MVFDALPQPWRDPNVLKMAQRMHEAGTAPNCFIVGAQKAGTTTLATMFSNITTVHVTPIKEPNFLSFDIRPASFTPAFKKLEIESGADALRRAQREDVMYAYIDDPDQYAELFSHAAGANLRCEASVTYLYSHMAPQAIADLFPQAQIVIILRDPVARLVSQYRMQVQAGVETEPDLMRAIQRDMARQGTAWGTKHLYVELGRYAPQIRRFLEVIPRHNLHVVFFEELFLSDDTQSKDRLWANLGLQTSGALSAGAKNQSQVPRSQFINRLIYQTGLKRVIQRHVPERLKTLGKRLFYAHEPHPLSDDEKRTLRELFVEDRIDLEQLLDRSAPWPKT